MLSIRLKLLGIASIVTLTLVQMVGAQQAPETREP